MFSLIVAAFVYFGYKEVTHLQIVQSLTNDIYTRNLPHLADNQRTLLNVENLRHIVQLAYYTDDDFVWRNSRIKARIIVGERLLTTDSAMMDTGLSIVELIDALIEIRAKIANYENSFVDKAIFFLFLLDDIADLFDKEADRESLFEVIDVYLKNGRENLRLLEYAKVYSLVNDSFELAMKTISKDKDLSQSRQAEIKRCEELVAAMFKDAMELENLTRDLNSTWVNLDRLVDNLIKMVRTGLEDSVNNNLKSIMLANDWVLTSTYGFLIGLILTVIVYFLGVRFFVSKPLRWTSKKLTDIQNMRIDDKAPIIHISEIATIADLLNRFGVQLAELYRRASLLDVEKAKRHDLTQIMRAVFKSSLDGYIVWNATQGIIEVNSRFVDYLGVSGSEKFLMDPGRYGLSPEYLAASFLKAEKTGFFRDEWELVSNAQETIPVEVTHLPIVLHDSTSLLSYFRDLRARKKHEESLRKAKEEAEAATRAKSLFLANMSHEIRTPMNGILGLVQLLLGTSLETPQMEYLTQIRTSADILLKIINDILDFSKIEANKLQIESIDINLESLLKTIVDFNAPQAERKGVELVLDFQPFMVSGLRGDPTRLSQVLNNLVSNAIKFTEKGYVSLKAGPAPINSESPAGRVEILFEVADTGIGLSQDQAESLFSAFTQADSSTTRKYGGTGLGLAISKGLVEKMGGEIWLSSQLAKGTLIAFTLPFELSSLANPPEPPPKRGARVMGLCQNPFLRENLIKQLEFLETAPTVVESSEDFLSLLEKCLEGPEALIMDQESLARPGLLERVRRLIPAAKAPLILITSSLTAVEPQTLNSSYQAVVVKPIATSSLSRAIKEALKETVKPAGPAASSAALAIPDLTGYKVLLAEDNEVNQFVAKKFLVKAGLNITIANNGAEALSHLERERFDVVLMDIQMPVMDGLEATRRIRAQAKYDNLPIVAMTAHAMAGDREISLQAGMVAHITKPIDFSQLFALLGRILKPKPDNSAKNSQEQENEEAANA
ncbi:MAG: response regulator [Deltaproteobacteria bacterium]|nr:response regulator [Deltaproteobacteria bacterium]